MITSSVDQWKGLEHMIHEHIFCWSMQRLCIHVVPWTVIRGLTTASSGYFYNVQRMRSKVASTQKEANYRRFRFRPRGMALDGWLKDRLGECRLWRFNYWQTVDPDCWSLCDRVRSYIALFLTFYFIFYHIDNGLLCLN